MREDRFTGKVAVITGAAGNIGEATSKAFAREGATVVVVDLNEEEGNRVVREIKEEGGDAMFIKTDVGVTADLENVFHTVVEKYGKADILCNIAGIISRKKLEDLDDAEWEKVVPINGKSYYTTMRLFVPHMAEHGGGVVVNVASLAAVKSDALETVYAFCKAGIVIMSKDIAMEYARRNIRINCVSPGMTPSKLNLHLPDIGEAISRIKIGRPATAQEQANAILFLASDEASFITGHNLIVDGGDYGAY